MTRAGGAVETSRLKGFYKLDVSKRVEEIARLAGLDEGDRRALLEMEGFGLREADHMIENVIGILPLPIGVAANFKIDGVDRLVPMAIEEPSVVAAASNSARRMREGDGIRTWASEPIMISQIQLTEVPDLERAAASVLAAKPELLAAADEGHDRLRAAGGGARDLECRFLRETRVGPMLIVHLLVDVRDAMGANAVNGMAEAIAPRLEELTGGRSCLKILSNYTTERRVRVEVEMTAAEIATENATGAEVATEIEKASALAEADPYRAATHNKGILNGIDAVLIATGQDFRAVEAGAHAWASRGGRYTALASWTRTPAGGIRGEMELPLSVGIVGGVTKVHPVVKVAIKILGVQSAADLARVAAAAGLAQNFGALHALATEGIQRGHMSLHARNVAAVAGAGPDEIAAVVKEIVAAGAVNEGAARVALARLRASR
ncbi:MAG: hydroxymethylglutaryl-CoA reductase, degradative [Deltaproteobacteria bacterium]|jgi:hydroxymethylglutaryl-CoA reductase|nr:hydroxymethylglutaryl-CoA reductase, degradative [Deltaproteobacteria bacterium]